jgi:hypothetical protein
MITLWLLSPLKPDVRGTKDDGDIGPTADSDSR